MRNHRDLANSANYRYKHIVGSQASSRVLGFNIGRDSKNIRGVEPKAAKVVDAHHWDAICDRLARLNHAIGD